MAKRSQRKKVLILLSLPVILWATILSADADKIFRDNHGAVAVITSYDDKGRPLSQGSGFIAKSDGVVVTNYHVIERAASVTVKLGSRITQVEGLVHLDRTIDVAVLKIRQKGLPSLKMGDISRAKVGDKVYVISSPQGLENTLSDGILSGIREIGANKQILQITAPISPGSSGGPVFNAAGEVIGIATFVLKGSQNLNFAVPVNLFRNQLDNRQLTSLGEMDVHQARPYWFNARDEENGNEQATDEKYRFVLDLIGAIVYLHDADIRPGMIVSNKRTKEPSAAVIFFDPDKVTEAQKRLEKWKGSKDIKIRKLSEDLSTTITQLMKMAEGHKNLWAQCAAVGSSALGNARDEFMEELCRTSYSFSFSQDKERPGKFFQLLDEVSELTNELPFIITKGTVDFARGKIQVPLQFLFSKTQLRDIGQYLETSLEKVNYDDGFSLSSLGSTRIIICNYVKKDLREFKDEDSYNSCSLR